MIYNCQFRRHESLIVQLYVSCVDDVGLEDDKTNIDVKKIKKQLITMDENLVNYKQLFEKLTIAKMRQELADEALEKKWKELNMGIEQWKHKYLYPFGQIEPIYTAPTST